MTGTCVIFDASNVLYRSFHADAARPEGALTAPDGFPTGALLGWYRTLLKFREMYQPEMMIAAFDGGIPQFRFDACPDYKANRAARDPGLKQQIDDAYTHTHLFGIPAIKIPQTEADDIIGTLAKKWGGDRVFIVSDDKDLGQCVTERVHQVKSPRGGDWRVCGPAEIQASFKVPVAQIPEFLALTGDSSDNIPGLPNVGPVTAVKWLTKYGSIASLIEKASTIEPARFAGVVAQNADALLGYLKVTTLHDVECEIPTAVGADKESLGEYLNMRGLKSVASRFEYLESRIPAKVPLLPGPQATKLAAKPIITQGLLF